MAADICARVHLVAEKLEQKAQDAQRNGNGNAARSLDASASDLRQAMALLVEQRHLLARRRGECDDEIDDTDVQELATQIGHVEAMLLKKSKDMKTKGNEMASTALEQAASTVSQGRTRLLEQQQTLFRLLGRWERLEMELESTNACFETRINEWETPGMEVMTKVRELVQLERLVKESLDNYHDIQDVRAFIERCNEHKKEAVQARKDAFEARQRVQDLTCKLAFEEINVTLKEENVASGERQECQVVEERVHENDQAIRNVIIKAATEVDHEKLKAKEECERLTTQGSCAYEALKEAMALIDTKIETVVVNAHELNREEEGGDWKIERLLMRLEELETLCSAKTLEQNHMNTLRKQCEEELGRSRFDRTQEMQKCTRLQTTLEAVTRKLDEMNVLKEEVWKVMALLSSYDDEVTVVDTLTTTVWECKEVATICEKLGIILNEFNSTRTQWSTTQADLCALCHERDSQMNDFQSMDWRVFAHDGEDEASVRNKFKTTLNYREVVAVAMVNSVRWLEELEEVRLNTMRERETLTSLENANEWLQNQLKASNAVLQKFEQKNESLHEQVVLLQQKNKAWNESISLQKRKEQETQQQNVLQLEQQLEQARHAFEKYRKRSHTALKSMEKRVEVLNRMQKEKEELLQEIRGSKEECEHARMCMKTSDVRVQETQRTLEMMQVEFDQWKLDNACVQVELQERFESERECLNAKVKEETLQIQELWTQQELMKAENAALTSRLTMVSASLDAAKEDLIQAHEALEASKVENAGQWKQLQEVQEKKEMTFKENELKINATKVEDVNTRLENDVLDGKRLESVLKQQLEDAHEKLNALQEQFAMTKAANAEQVFALKEQCDQLKVEVTQAKDNVRCKTMSYEALQAERDNHEQPSSSHRFEDLQLKVQDATKENALLTRALDGCRHELQEAHEINEKLMRSSNPENESSTSLLPVLHAKDEALKKLRVQNLALQDEIETLRLEKNTLEHAVEELEFKTLHTTRRYLYETTARDMQAQTRHHNVTRFEQHVTTLCTTLQKRLEAHSEAFRIVTDFQATWRAWLSTHDDSRLIHDTRTDVMDQEVFVLRSGVVIKAGARFELPVYCDASLNRRVVWNFSIQEDTADVAFQLTAMRTTTRLSTLVVAKERLHSLSGVFHGTHENVTLVFEWDNTFSWLNEKTLDYHVSILEPLSREEHQMRWNEDHQEQRSTKLQQGLVLIQTEAACRDELKSTLEHLNECEGMKRELLNDLEAQKERVDQQLTVLNEERERVEMEIGMLVTEQEACNEAERRLVEAWETAMTERLDVEMTLQLAGTNEVQIKELTHELDAEVTKKLSRGMQSE